MLRKSGPLPDVPSRIHTESSGFSVRWPLIADRISLLPNWSCIVKKWTTALYLLSLEVRTNETLTNYYEYVHLICNETEIVFLKKGIEDWSVVRSIRTLPFHRDELSCFMPKVIPYFISLPCSYSELWTFCYSPNWLDLIIVQQAVYFSLPPQLEIYSVEKWNDIPFSSFVRIERDPVRPFKLMIFWQ